MIVFLDSGILGLVSSPSNLDEARECKQWLAQLLARGAYVVSSDICDYEVMLVCRGGLYTAFSGKGIYYSPDGQNPGGGGSTTRVYVGDQHCLR